MFSDLVQPYVNYVPPLLEAGVRVLIYAGDADYICNWIGNKAWITAVSGEYNHNCNLVDIDSDPVNCHYP